MGMMVDERGASGMSAIQAQGPSVWSNVLSAVLVATQPR